MLPTGNQSGRERPCLFDAAPWERARQVWKANGPFSNCWQDLAGELRYCSFANGFGFPEDGETGIGVFPNGEEVLIGGFGFGGVALQSVGAG